MMKAPAAASFPEYPASWYLFGESSEVGKHPVSRSLLGRTLVCYRATNGLVMMDARCSHMGADLGCGHVEGDLIVCPYHNWKYAANGACQTASGMKVPPKFARQRTFPVVERHGYIFFFNGPDPVFPLPFFCGESSEHYVAGKAFRYEADCTWYVNAAHAFDRQHFDAVHDRRLLGPPEIDCPAPFARRNRYRAEVLGRTRLDKVLRRTAGQFVDISLTVWGGTFVCITGDFERARSRFLMVTRPLENGHTVCEGIVMAPRPANFLSLWLRRFFTYGYLRDEAEKIRGTRYDPSRFVEADADMVEYFNWLTTLPQSATAPAHLQPIEK